MHSILYGFGGVGKRTLGAPVIQELSSTNFAIFTTIVDVDNSNKTPHIVKLQKDIIYDLGGEKIDLRNVDEGQQKLRIVLINKSSCLFIDNIVDNDYIKQLLPRDLSRAKRKLRFIITSREKNVSGEYFGLPLHLNANVMLLNEDSSSTTYKDALEIF
eukprot:Gb_03821 [translate_table: standard]